MEVCKHKLLEIIMHYKSLIIFLVLAMIAPMFSTSEYTLHILCMMLLFSFLASSWNILGGFCGQFAMGNGVYMALGAYIVGVLFRNAGISPWLGIIIAGLIVAVVAMAISFPCFKLRGSYFSLVTVAILYVFNLIIISERYVFGIDLGSAMGLRIPWRGGFQNMQFKSKLSYYYIILAMLCVLLIVCMRMKRSKMGFYFAAINTNQEAAESLGVSAIGYKLRAQFLSAFFTAVGGGFYMMFTMYLEPGRILSYDFSIEIVLYVIIGGIGTIWGPVLGAILLYPLKEMLHNALGTSIAGLSTVIYGLCMMLVIFFMRSGVFPWVLEKIKHLIHYNKLSKKTSA